MARIDNLNSVDLRYNWLAVSNGTVVAIKKDSRFIRIFKCIAGYFTGKNYYEHINRDRVLSAIISIAEADSERPIESYIGLARRIGRAEEARRRIFPRAPQVMLQPQFSQPLPQHETIRPLQPVNTSKAVEAFEVLPEMIAQYDEKMKAYKLPHFQSNVTPVSHQEHDAHQKLFTLSQQIYGKQGPLLETRDDPKCPVIQLLLQAQTQYPHDSKGNNWIDVKLHCMIKALIPQDKFEHEQGIWWKVILPACTPSFGLKSGSYPTKDLVIYIKQEGNLKSNQQGMIEVIVEEHKTRVQNDGTARLPNGWTLDVATLGPNYSNSIICGIERSELFSYEPFNTPRHEAIPFAIR